MPQHRKSGRRLLSHPTVDLTEYDGMTISARVRLQDRKAVREVQPDPRVAVCFAIDGAGLPVWGEFYHVVPVPTVRRLLAAAIQSPGAGGAPRAALGPADLRAAVRGCREALRRITPAARRGKQTSGLKD